MKMVHVHIAAVTILAVVVVSVLVYENIVAWHASWVYGAAELAFLALVCVAAATADRS